MSEGLKPLTGIAVTAFTGPIIFVAMGTPGYIPSARLADMARQSSGLREAQEAIADALHDVRAGRRGRPYQHITADEVGIGIRRFMTWQNDEGFLSTTIVDCRNARRCTVTASAILNYGWT